MVISAEDILPSSSYWSGPGHWGVKAREKEKRFYISILWKPYCLQNKLIAPVYLCLAPLLWKKGRVVICFIVLHIVTLQEYLTCALSMACAVSLSKEKGYKWMESMQEQWATALFTSVHESSFEWDNFAESVTGNITWLITKPYKVFWGTNLLHCLKCVRRRWNSNDL